MNNTLENAKAYIDKRRLEKNTGIDYENDIEDIMVAYANEIIQSEVVLPSDEEIFKKTDSEFDPEYVEYGAKWMCDLLKSKTKQNDRTRKRN